MKKHLIIILLAIISQQLFGQNESIYTKKDTTILFKPISDAAVYEKKETESFAKLTTYNTARFLRFEQPSFSFGGVGYGADIPGLIYTFTLTKNTIIQISETVAFSTYGVDLFGAKTITSFRNSIVIDRERFASFSTEGIDIVSSSGGTVLAQLGPGVHTIKIHVGIKEEANMATIYGYDKDRGNRTFMSLLFFEQ